MGIQVYRDISVDFSNSRYIIINAKQYDSKSRFIRMTCTNVGQKVNLTPDDYSAFIRFRKSDGYGIFNKCIISTSGEVIFELTEQMLSTVGTGYADLVILDVAKNDINSDTTIVSSDGKIIENNGSLASTMSFYINVMERPLNDDDIESTNEFSALNELLLKAETDYDYIVEQSQEYMNDAKTYSESAASSESNAKIYSDNSKKSANASANSATESKGYLASVKEFAEQITSDTNKAKDYADSTNTSADKAKLSEDSAKISEQNSETYSNASKSYAIGEGGYRTNEAIDNSKFYALQAKTYSESAASSESNAANLLSQTTTQATNASTAAANAKVSEDKAKEYLDDAQTAALNASVSETNASTSATNAKASEDKAKEYKDSIESRIVDGETAATNAETFATNAEQSYQNVLGYDNDCQSYAKQAKSYAVGGTNLRENEDTDNAAYYYDQLQRIITGLSGGLFPMGTITFEDLENQTKQQGYMFNILNDFVSTSNFKDGGNIPYAAGTNVYYTADGKWDCLSSSLLLGIKGDAESIYRKGYVNVTPENIGSYSKSETYSQTEINTLLNNLKDNTISEMQTTISSLQDEISSLKTTITDLTTRLIELEKLNSVTIMIADD